LHSNYYRDGGKAVKKGLSDLALHLHVIICIVTNVFLYSVIELYRIEFNLYILILISIYILRTYTLYCNEYIHYFYGQIINNCQLWPRHKSALLRHSSSAAEAQC
jgi:hypothetical protein